MQLWRVICIFFFNDTATTEIYTYDTLFPYTTLFRSALLGQFENGQERDHHAEPAFARLEQRLEAVEAAVLQPREQLAHALAHAERVAFDRVAGEQLGALEHVVQGQQHLAQVHRRRLPEIGRAHD